MKKLAAVLFGMVVLNLNSAVEAGTTTYASGYTIPGTQVTPGQYLIAGIQDICLVDDGTWYGTTFNFAGKWARNSVAKFRAELWGTYTVHDAAGAHKANTTLTFLGEGTFELNWHDWFDDASYGTFLVSSIEFVKAECDPPFRGQNTHAATE